VPTVTPELIRHIAELARLELTPDEVTRYAEQVGKVLSYVEELNSVNVDGVEPMVQPFDVETPLRDDVAKVFTPGKILESATDVVQDGFKVPQIMEAK